ncbi:sterol desaturase family protein [Fodinicurvata sp. EGI_FJ10296]|uniref:sterol desaturase family protein n=1 Tax=Fodinicurvata sp. EGI_FJ10296 TaxID=3231908 RepID=UPI0034554659
MDQSVQALVNYKGIAVVAWLAALFMLERLAPRTPAPPDLPPWRRVTRNAMLWVFNSGLSPLVVIPVSVWATSHALDWRPAWWSGAPGLIIDLLILDCWIYWWHRANHESQFLWRFHEIHHLDEFLDTTSAIRFHFGEVLMGAAVRALIVILLGIPIASIIVFETLILIAAVFHHSNIRLAPRLEAALQWVVITPGIHWVHHHAIRRDTDSNYGTILSVWDRLFATRSRTRRWAGMPIGVENRRELDIGRLILRPFRPRDDAAGGKAAAVGKAEESADGADR